MEPLVPHHDGSPLYVSNLDPTLGETVRVRVRVPVGIRTARGGAHAVESRPRAGVDGCRPHRLSGRLGLVGGRRRGRQPAARLPLDAPARGRPRALAESVGPAHARDAGCRGLRSRRRSRRRRPGCTTRSCTRCSPTGSRARPQADDHADAGLGDRRRSGAIRSTPSMPARSQQFYGGDLDGVIDKLDHLVELGVEPAVPHAGVPRSVESPLRRVELPLASTRCSAATRRTSA